MAIIIVADDHELIREAVKPYLAQLDPDATLVDASSYEDVLSAVAAAKKDGEALRLVLLDLGMPGNSPHDIFLGLRKVKQAAGAAPVAIFSADEDAVTVGNALKNGAQGYVPKTVRGKSLVSALRLILAGEIYVPPLVANARTSAPATPAGAIGADLSARELECLRMLVKGITNKEIARELEVQEVTVKLHLRNAYRKIGASNRVEAVRIVVEQGLT